MGMAAVEERTRPVRVQQAGRVLYLGRATEAEARRLEAEARAVLAAGGRVAARSVRQASGCVVQRDPGAPVEAERSPEEALMVAVLEDAERALRSRDVRARREAERWFASDDRSHVFAFASICDVLDLDPHRVRRGIVIGTESGR